MHDIQTERRFHISKRIKRRIRREFGYGVIFTVIAGVAILAPHCNEYFAQYELRQDPIPPPHASLFEYHPQDALVNITQREYPLNTLAKIPQVTVS